MNGRMAWDSPMVVCGRGSSSTERMCIVRTLLPLLLLASVTCSGCCQLLVSAGVSAAEVLLTTVPSIPSTPTAPAQERELSTGTRNGVRVESRLPLKITPGARTVIVVKVSIPLGWDGKVEAQLMSDNWAAFYCPSKAGTVLKKEIAGLAGAVFLSSPKGSRQADPETDPPRTYSSTMLWNTIESKNIPVKEGRLWWKVRIKGAQFNSRQYEESIETTKVTFMVSD